MPYADSSSMQHWPPLPLLSSIVKHVQQDYPRESCGVWSVDFSGSWHHHPLQNKLPPPLNQKGFLFDTLEWLSLLEKQDAKSHTLQGIYHSHPDQPPLFSQADQQALVFEGQPSYPKLLQMIVGVSPSQLSLALYQWDQKNKCFQEVEKESIKNLLPLFQPSVLRSQETISRERTQDDQNK